MVYSLRGLMAKTHIQINLLVYIFLIIPFTSFYNSTLLLLSLILHVHLTNLSRTASPLGMVIPANALVSTLTNPYRDDRRVT